MSTDICIFEDHGFKNLYPLSLTRPVWNLKCGMLSLKNKITKRLPGAKVTLLCRDDKELTRLEKIRYQDTDISLNNLKNKKYLFVNGRLLANSNFLQEIDLTTERVYVKENEIVAGLMETRTFRGLIEKSFDMRDASDLATVTVNVNLIRYPWDLVRLNVSELVNDFFILNMAGQIKGSVSKDAVLIETNGICIEEDSTIKAGAVLDASEGPIFIGRDVTVKPNAVVQGPAAILDHSTINIGAQIYPGTTIGEVCRVGGEVAHSIMHSYSNKQHGGFIGHSYIGKWVNFGAGSNNSNLKNNLSTVKVSIDGNQIDSGERFVGAFVGDHTIVEGKAGLLIDW